MLALLQAINHKGEAIAVKEIEFNNTNERAAQLKDFASKKQAFCVSAVWATGKEYYYPYDHSFMLINK